MEHRPECDQRICYCNRQPRRPHARGDSCYPASCDCGACICPSTCDCEAPDAEVARCSNLCPEHNLYPDVDEECTARVHRNGGVREGEP